MRTLAFQTLDQGVYVGRYARIGQTRTDLLDTTRAPYACAELVADWYRRNVMIYSKMLKWMDFTERRIVLIIGNGHVSILTPMADFGWSPLRASCQSDLRHVVESPNAYRTTTTVRSTVSGTKGMR